tara:strand:+ start:953 stop:1171 length:219 start_codon:yes stop_codon:yes gene_type:complete
MGDFTKIANELKKNIQLLTSAHDDILAKIRNEKPDEVDAIIRDNKKVLDAINNKDLSVLNELHKKYANNTHK